MSCKGVAWFAIRGRLQEVQPYCKNNRKAVSTTVVKVLELACEGVKMKRKNARLSSRTKDMEAKLVESRVAGSTIRGLLEAAEWQLSTLKRKLADAVLVLEKSASKTFWEKVNFEARMLVVEDSHWVEKVHVKRAERECGAEIKKTQQVFAESRDTNQAACRQLADGEEFLQYLQSKIFAVTPEMNRSRWASD